MNTISHTRINNYVKLEEAHDEIKTKLQGLVRLGAITREYGERLYYDVCEYSRRCYLHGEDSVWVAIETSAETGAGINECFESGMALLNEETLFN